MRTQFIEAATRHQAKKLCPWASHLAKVTGGYMAFESHDDYTQWKKQR